MKDSAKRIALAALFAALVSGGKLALMFIPNVEVVSILLAVAGYCFALCGVVGMLNFVKRDVR